jgi:hypothetical protein
VLAASIIAMMMEAASTSETSVNFYQMTRHNNQEVSHLHTHRHENLKSQIRKCLHNSKLNADKHVTGYA